MSYDLAVIRFEKNIDLAVLNINDDKISIRENVRSMGNPDSVKNVINDGEINCFSYVTLNNEKSKVDFEVIVHSAQISSGSSGGALLDSKNNIIGKQQFITETNAQQANMCAYYSVMKKPFDYQTELIEKLKSVTSEQLQDCANKYFTDKYLLAVLKP